MESEKASVSLEKSLTEIFGVTEEGLQAAFFKNDTFLNRKALIGDAVLDFHVREHLLKLDSELVPEDCSMNQHGAYVANDTMRHFMITFGGKFSEDIKKIETHDIGTVFEHLLCVSSHQDQFLSFYFSWCDKVLQNKPAFRYPFKPRLESKHLDEAVPASFVKFFRLTVEQVSMLSTDTSLQIKQRAFVGIGALKLSVLKYLVVQYYHDNNFIAYFADKLRDSSTIRSFMKKIIKFGDKPPLNLEYLFEYGLGLTSVRELAATEYIEWAEKHVIHPSVFRKGGEPLDYPEIQMKAILIKRNRKVIGKTGERKEGKGKGIEQGKFKGKAEGKGKGKGKGKEKVTK